jgi:hypothetical protein
MQKRAEETKPWAIITIMPPDTPQFVQADIPAIINLMWETEEYAINDFKSVWVKQISLVRAPPQQQNGIR